MSTRNGKYIHGTDPDEQRRLSRLNDLLNARSLDALDIHLGDRILDVGCGLSQLTRAMARKAGSDGLVVGVEQSAEQIAEAQRQADAAGESGLVDIRRGNATSLPLADDEWGTFDVVHTRFLLEHVPDPEAVVAGMFRAVRPGGRVILEDDDHDVLRLSPEVPGFDRLWDGYVEMYRSLGCDPFIGRRLVSLLRGAGATSTHNDWKFFGGCHGAPMFEELVANFIGIIDGARDGDVPAALRDVVDIVSIVTLEPATLTVPDTNISLNDVEQILVAEARLTCGCDDVGAISNYLADGSIDSAVMSSRSPSFE